MPRLVAPGLHPPQIEVWDDPTRFVVLAAGRRWGKTRLGTLLALRVALTGGRAWWVAPTYSIAMEGWYTLMALVGQVPGATILKSLRRIELPGGGVVEVRSGDNPQRLRGAGLDFLVLDEAAFLNEQIWFEVLRPTLTDRAGRALFISTPKGYNWFYDLTQRAKEYEDWAFYQYPTSTNPFIDPAELEAAKREVGSHVFSQEYMAEFVELGGGMFKSDWLRYFDMAMTGIGSPEPRTAYSLYDTDGTNGQVIFDDVCERFVTCDPALSLKETADYTVFASCLLTPDRKLLIKDVTRGRWEAPDIITEAERLAVKHDAHWVGFESVAFQSSLIQYARRSGLPTKALKADRDKRQRALPLQARMESGDVYFLRNAPWLSELERELLTFPVVEHDDQVDALAYAALQTVRRKEWAAY